MNTILRKHAPGAAAAPLTYWLALLCGLAALTVQRIDASAKVVPIWIGAVVGTLLGQFLGARRVRLWLLLFVVGNATWCGAIVSAPLWLALWSSREAWQALELALTAFAPAAICGYFSLSERGGLQAFWFPAVLWTLALLDGNGVTNLEGPRGWLLLAALSALFIAFLHGRETRRVALWREHATAEVARPLGEATLRESPLRSAAPAAWIAGLGVATLAFTAWIAPNLWQKDRLPKQAVSVASIGTGAGADGRSGPCCPDATSGEVERTRVRELFDVLSAQDGRPPPPPPIACVDCSSGKRAGGEAGTMAGGAGAGTGSVTEPAGPSAPSTVSGPRRSPPSPGNQRGLPATPPQARVQPSPPAVTKPRAPAAPPPTFAEGPPPAPPPPIARSTTSPVPPPPRRVIAAARPAVVPVPASDPPYAWLVGVALATLLAQLSLRPLRRFVTLRHLRRPLWAEPTDQRVSNLWQLALVGLRDLGWRVAPGEQPHELARRTGVEGLGACATVLERVRHGVRVDAGDLETMERAAQSAYDATQRSAGWAGRAAGWMRWPLV